MMNENYWTKREELHMKAMKHTEEMQNKYANEINKAIKNSIIWTRKDDTTELIKEADGVETCLDERMVEIKNQSLASIKVLKSTTVEAIKDSIEEHLVVLNFASYKNPGGKFLEGSSAQEESLCHSSFLYNVLRELKEYYAWNNEHLNRGLYTDRAVYTPDVIFTDENGNTHKADVITCAAPNREMLVRYERFTEKENLQALASRVRFLKSIAYLSNPEAQEIILGAWGCGVFAQESSTVCKYLLEAFANSNYNFVTFAIPDNKNLKGLKELLTHNE